MDLFRVIPPVYESPLALARLLGVINSEYLYRMKTAILTFDSDRELSLLIELANKLGIQVLELSDEQLEEYGLGKAIKEGKTGDIIETDKFIEFLTR